MMRARGSWRWTPAEKRVLARYVRGLAAGRLRSRAEACNACAGELARLARRCRGEPDCGRPRSPETVRYQIRRLRLPVLKARFHGAWTPQEDAVIVRFVRAVAHGKLPSLTRAARPCLAAVNALLVRRARRRMPISPGSRRTLNGVSGRLFRLARNMGMHGPRRTEWADAERKAAVRWLRRPSMVETTVGSTARRLQQKLADMGFKRTLLACRLWLSRHRERNRRNRGRNR